MDLYSINSEYQNVLEQLEAMDDLDEDIIRDTLSSYKSNLDEKCLSVGAFIKNLKAEANAVKEAENSLKARRVRLENKVERMREYLAENLPGKISNAETKLSPIKAKDKIIIDDIDLLPESCIKIQEKSAIAAEVKKLFDDLPEGAAHKEKTKVGVMIK